MGKLTLDKTLRMEDLEKGIHQMCQGGARDPDEYLDILQAYNDKKKGYRVEVVTVAPPVFLSPSEQFQAFIAYNEWLKKNYRGDVIAEAKMKAVEAKLKDLDPEALLFYCHQADVVLTTELAWWYACSYREKVWKSDSIKWDKQYLKANEREPVRPEGFYIAKRPPEDKEAIGRRFQGDCVRDVREKLGKDWGMGSEGVQLVGITHKHYPELMNGKEFPFIDLPGLAVSPHADGLFDSAACLYFHKAKLKLDYADVGPPGSRYGSGSLQQCVAL